MSPQYHSASCRAMLLFIPLLVTGVGLGGFGGSAVERREEEEVYIGGVDLHANDLAPFTALGQVSAYKSGRVQDSLNGSIRSERK